MASDLPAATARGNHFSCSLSAVLLACVRDAVGPQGVKQVLELAESERSPEYLTDLSNWISYDEAVALWRAGSRVTHHPQFPRLVGETAAKRLNASPVAALLRSLGSPEACYRQIAVMATKFSAVAEFEAGEVGPGFAELIATAAEGFARNADHCAWTCGLLTQNPVLFGRPPATVTHEECEAYGAERCRYIVRWEVDESDGDIAGSEVVDSLREQLDAMRERLHSMFATASDLIGAEEIGDVLARITDRAAIEVRAPRYLLAVRTNPGGEVHCHHKGFGEDEAREFAAQILERHPASFPPSWLVVPVRSKRQDYGRLMAMNEQGGGFFPQERELFEVYARYAASALDGATALLEAKRRYDQSSALLNLARTLAEAGTSGEVARRLADAVPVVVDCDHVDVYLWDGAASELVSAIPDGEEAATPPFANWKPLPGGPLERLLDDPRPEPIFVDPTHGDPRLREVVRETGSAAMIAVPLTAPDSLLGLLIVSVSSDPGRLAPSHDLLDRLSGVAAQATIALQNGRLVDQITHQALHDQLTGLANRLKFTDRLRTALRHAANHGRTVTVFYIDLDGFKPVNDEFGHEVGDQVLYQVGERIIARVRGSDVVARLGGDEFAVLIDNETSEEDAEALIDRLNQAFATAFVVDGHTLNVGGSIGRAVYPDDASDAEGLLRVADAAMFEAKRSRQEAREGAYQDARARR
jgi:diguanylate cyclase (GGDEF)-like protein